MGLIPAAGMLLLIWPLPRAVPAATTSCSISKWGKMVLSSPFWQEPALGLPGGDMPPSTLAALGSLYPMVESDPSGLEPVTELDLGLNIFNSQLQRWGSLVPIHQLMGMLVYGQ